MVTQQIIIGSDDQRLAGTFVVPDGPSLLRAVLMAHGGPGGDKHGPSNVFDHLADRLAQKGIASLCVDFRGSGESVGDFVNTTLSGEVADLKASYQHLVRNGYKHIGLVGESLGGTIAVLGSDDEYEALALWFPAIYLMETSLAAYFAPQRVEELQAVGYISETKRRIGRGFLDEVRTVALEPMLRRIARPILFVHGDDDHEVPYTQSLRAADLVRGPKRVEIVTGGGHGLRRPDEQQRLIDLTTTWFATHLGV